MIRVAWLGRPAIRRVERKMGLKAIFLLIFSRMEDNEHLCCVRQLIYEVLFEGQYEP